MISKNKDGSVQLRAGDLSVFLNVIEEQYKIYSDFFDKKSKIDDMTSEEIIRLNHDQIHPLYICTIFSAMFLEAYIYDYIARKRSSSFAQSLDKLEPSNKWKIGTELCNSKGIDVSKNSYQELVNLFKLRNNLAHNKSTEFTWDKYDSSSFKQKVLKPVKCVDIILNILSELCEIDDTDVFAKFVISRLTKLKDQYKA